MNKNENIKRRIYEMRRQRGYSQEYMASILNISLNSYRKIEKGGTNLVSSRLDDIAKVLGITCDDLVFDLENDKPEYSLAKQEKQELINNIDDLKKYITHLEQLINLQKEKLESYSRND